MKALTGIAAGGAVAALGVTLWHLNPTPEAQLRENWVMLERYCVDCHNDAELTGGISFEGADPENIHSNPEMFEAAIRKLRVGMMPPRTEPQPAPELRTAFLTSLESTLDAAAQAQPFAGTKPVHRLNRAEYANAVRDLLGVTVDVSELLPSDGGDFGFDNIAAALTTSPFLLERYLTAAQRIGALALGDPEAVPTAAAYKIGVEVTQNQYMEGLPLGTRGGTAVTHIFPADAEYEFSGRLLRTVAEGYVGVEGHAQPHEFVITIDGDQVYSAMIGGPEDHELSSQDIVESRVAVDARMTSPRIAVTAGPHEIGFTWTDRPGVEQNIWQPSLRNTQEAHNPAGLPRLETVSVAGPFDVTGVSDTPARERIFVCRPRSGAEEAECAQEIVTTLARRAFRRPVETEDVAAPLEFYDDVREQGGDFDRGIRAAVTRILVSPSFLFRTEVTSADIPAGGVHDVSDIEFASRLSFFLWSSIPDEELLSLAESNRLREPGVLAAQVERMIADERSSALIENFTGQWLQLRNLEARVVPDLLLFPDFDDNLRKAFRRETELLFASVLQEGQSVLRLLDAGYTYLNERLARHYGIAGVYGARFRRVEIDDVNRRGLLGHGSVLALTSAATRTSPIIRGKYIVSNLLNNPPPLPPDVVPALEESAPEDRPSSVREQLERHRAEPFCASCHNNLDPLGFALENFNAVGQWREVDRAGLPIDSAGVLADGTPVDGPVALREAILARPEVFAGTVTEKLLIYALGRGLDARDMPHVRRIVRNAAQDDYSLESIVLGIVDSVPFQMRSIANESGTLSTVAQTRE